MGNSVEVSECEYHECGRRWDRAWSEV